MKRPESIRLIRETGCQPDSAKFYESLFFQGNGRFGYRGFRDEEEPGSKAERSTFAAGFYGELKPGLTDMVNCPDFHYTRLEVEGKAVFPASSGVSQSCRELDLDTGILSSRYTFITADGARLLISSFRFPSLADRRLAVHSMSFESPDRDMTINLTAGIDGTTRNRPVHDDQLKKNDDLVNLRETVRREEDGSGLFRFGARALGTGIILEMAMAVSFSEGVSILATEAREDFLTGQYAIFLPRGTKQTFDRLTILATSRDPFGTAEGPDLAAAVSRAAREAAEKGVPELRREQEQAWERIWEAAEVGIIGDDSLTLGLRFSVFQLVQAAAMDDPGVSIGARGLSHSRYKGCFFWDTDVFMLPFFALTFPEAASSLLEYRYRTLEGARRNAAAQGLKGARYAWMASLDGREQCDTWDIGLSEVHITADVAWSLDACRQWMGNEEWYLTSGVEILIETARYWVSRFSREEGTGRYNLLSVKGPDEYGGVTLNNYFTVAMARANLLSAAKAVEEVRSQRPEDGTSLKLNLNFDPSEADNWKALAANCVLPFDEERLLPLEDALFLKKEPFDFQALKQGDHPLYKTVPFDRLQRLRVIKQADLVLLGRLLPGVFTLAEERTVWDFYEPLTAHDSTLSFGSHAETAAVLGLLDEAEDYLVRAARLDLDDRMANVGDEGLHLAACGGAWRALVLGFAGLDVSGDLPVLSPVLAPRWKGFYFHFTSRGKAYRSVIERDHWSVYDSSDNLVSSGSLKTGRSVK
jgi:kojibiose phosphorylase